MTGSDRTPIALEDRDSAGARLSSPSAARNAGPISDVLARILPQGAVVQEIGSGTGEHALAACRARGDIAWRPSDPDPQSRASQDAWAAELDGRIAPSREIDASASGWWREIDPFDALVCMNVIHISPWPVAEGLAAGAAGALKPGGLIFLYGPFKEGEATAPSNLSFDENLKARDPRWGVRDLEDVCALMAGHGFDLAERIDMPANNLSLVFRRSAEADR